MTDGHIIKSQPGKLTWTLQESGADKIVVALALGVPAAFLVLGGLYFFAEETITTVDMALLVGLGAVLSVALGVLLILQNKPRELVLLSDRLDIPGLGWPLKGCKSLLLGDLDAVIEVDDYLVIVDGAGRQQAVSRRNFAAGGEYESFKNALMGRIDALGNLEQVRAGTAREEEKLRRNEPRFTPVVFGFSLVLAILFAVQFVVLGTRELSFPGDSRFQLLDAGGLWATSVVDLRWDRLFTAGLTHTHILELLIVSTMVVAIGFGVERYLGAVNTAIVLSVGLLAGSVGSLLLAGSDVVVGAWSGAYALFGAGLYLFVRKNSELAIVHRRLGRQLLVALIAATFIVHGLAFLPLAALAIYPVAGVVAGVITAHLLLRSSEPLGAAVSVGRRVVAAVFGLLFLAAFATSAVHAGGDDLQEDRLALVRHLSESADTETEQRDFLRDLVSDTSYLSEFAEQAELIAEAIRHGEFGGETVAQSLVFELRQPFPCGRDDADVQAWHSVIASALDGEESDKYLDSITRFCG